MVKQGSGSTNDGNTARKFFENYEIISQITGIEKELIKRLYIILQSISSSKPFDISKFRTYTFETAQLYVNKYCWFYMPVSMQKILIHGAEIIKYFHIPIGCLSEEPLEANNEKFKANRLSHTRKTSRKKRMRIYFNIY